MRYPASEKLEIIRIVEQSHLPAKLTLDKLGIARRTFYRHRHRAACGTGSRLTSMIRSSNWRWSSPS
jgi:predicted DNA-binding protein (UPF0251 family)